MATPGDGEKVLPDKEKDKLEREFNLYIPSDLGTDFQLLASIKSVDMVRKLESRMPATYP